MFKTPYEQMIYTRSYARWDDEHKRRETWNETVERYGRFMIGRVPEGSRVEFTMALGAILLGEVMPSMRLLWTAGKAAEIDNICAYNCAYLVIDNPKAFAELMYILMCGTGVGYSVERQYINKLPSVPSAIIQSGEPIVFRDSKQGWADGYLQYMRSLYAGVDLPYDLSKIRKKGALLKTFGGRASGPEPLDKLLKFTAQVFKQALGRGLSSIECYDICCYIAEVIVAGGTRRSACISLSNLSDDRMAKAKSGDFILMRPQRRMSNNSVAYTEKPDSRKLISEFIKLIESQSGERGIFNREAANFTIARTDRREIGHDWGCNPCGEILLRPFEFCNLTECIVRPDDTLESLKSKVDKATILGCVQSTLTNFKFIRRIWTKNCEEECLLGVSLTGLRDHPLLKKKSAEAIRWLKEMKEVSIVTAKKWSRILDIPMPKAITCVKPSGTVSQLVDCSSGLHPRHAPYYIRRVRVASTDPVAKLLRDSGVPNQPETGDDQHNPNTVVFEFPHRSPEGSVLTDEVGALEQLKYWKMLKQHWCEHNPSCTIYVKESEWTQVLAWVDANWYQISGITFLPHNTGVYQLAPYEEIDEETYDWLVSAMPPVDFNRLNEFEQSNETTGSQEYACSGGGCEI